MTSQFDDFLGTNSSLTRTQIKRIELQISLQNPGSPESQGESRSEISGVSAGAYYRVLSQAKNNIDQALYTILLCARIGVLQMEDLRRLLDLIAKTPSDLAEAETEQVMPLIQALVSKIVML
jgi:hypothetical protein